MEQVILTNGVLQAFTTLNESKALHICKEISIGFDTAMQQRIINMTYADVKRLLLSAPVKHTLFYALRKEFIKWLLLDAHCVLADWANCMSQAKVEFKARP